MPESGTYIREMALAKEAADAHLELLEAAEELVRLSNVASLNDSNVEFREAWHAAHRAIRRCQAWNSKLPQPQRK